jgi:hypothetical protein
LSREHAATIHACNHYNPHDLRKFFSKPYPWTEKLTKLYNSDWSFLSETHQLIQRYYLKQKKAMDLGIYWLDFGVKHIREAEPLLGDNDVTSPPPPRQGMSMLTATLPVSMAITSCRSLSLLVLPTSGQTYKLSGSGAMFHGAGVQRILLDPSRWAPPHHEIPLAP